jgi:cysteine-rich repeat protein
VNCTASACGNGIVAATEACDDGNASDADACLADCTDARCGDAAINESLVANEVVFEWLTSCSATAGIRFFIGGQLVHADVLGGNCNCFEQIQTVTLTDPSTLAALHVGSTRFGMEADGYINWAVATVRAPGVADQEVVLYDAAGGGDAEARNADFCSTTYELNPTIAPVAAVLDGLAEECDDGNTDDADGCESDCTLLTPPGGVPVDAGAESGAAGADPNDGTAGAGGDGNQPGRTTLGVLDAGPACVPRHQGLLHFWPAEGDTRDVVAGLDGVLEGGSTFASGMVGQAFSFVGDGSGIWIPGSDGIALQELTLAMWVQTRSLPAGAGSGTVLAKQATGQPGTAPGQASYAVEIDASGRPVFSLWDGIQALRIVSSSGLANGAWHHIVASRRGSLMLLYVDGVEVASGVIDGAIAYGPGAGLDLEFGSFLSYGTSRALDGLVDEVSIFDRALDATEIQEIHQSGSAGYCLP